MNIPATRQNCGEDILPHHTECVNCHKSIAEAIGLIAVLGSEVNEFGCPYCGYRSGSMPMSGGGGGIWTCGDCGGTCVVLADGVTKSPIGLGRGNDETVYPELRDHPRRGIPKHGRPDKKPEGGGEFFRSRGIGLDDCTCFICGTHDRDGEGHTMLNNICAFVQCKVAGERVVALFDQGARMDYREFEPDRVQVKVGACDKHRPNLELLNELTHQADGVITKAMIEEVSAL